MAPHPGFPLAYAVETYLLVVRLLLKVLSVLGAVFLRMMEAPFSHNIGRTVYCHAPVLTSVFLAPWVTSKIAPKDVLTKVCKG